MAALALLVVGQTWAARESNVRATKHNFSSALDNSPVPGRPLTSVPVRTVKSSESQVCVFCHTPHAATSGAIPLWNRALSTATYTVYTSDSLDANQIQTNLNQPGGSSKLCLSCHDGTLAIGNVNVLNGASPVSIGMTGTAAGKMPDGQSSGTGFTRLLGIDLKNDHPISVTYTTALANRDGELRVVDANQKWPATTGTTIGVRTSGYKPKLPLEPTGSGATPGQVQCATCHDPHIRETVPAMGNQKFLRLNRFQEAQPTGGTTFSEANDTICLSCHDKDKGGVSWAYSAHANALVANETYTLPAATQREFPAGMPVWKAACLNCHDTHTVPGSRRLLREGTNSTASPKSNGKPAIEETCYQCHSALGTSILESLANTVPDIKTDYTTAGNKSMPITDLGQGIADEERHNIGGNFNNIGFIDCTGNTNTCGKDFIESRELLGRGNLTNRHAECTDCHNPHRVVKFKDFRGAGGNGNITGAADASGTHKHTDDATDIHNNIASGVLRGTWGVEPTYTSMSFHALPTGYTVKRGDPESNSSALVGDGYVTREYQICLKCHSDYAYTDDNVYPSSTARPQLGPVGSVGPKTAQNANGHTNFTSYTNQAKEFQAPNTHAVPVGSVNLGFDGGAGTAATVTATNSNNHRSWHPVMKPTGRLNRAGAWRAPWNNSGTGGKAGRLGVQTMYCSDCHGSATAAGTVIPNLGENGKPWGPHGSSNNFLLKGPWDTGSGEGNADTLCFKCHEQNEYASTSGTLTGWQTNDSEEDGHKLHANRISTPLRCNWCHVAVPHGWKNRNLLVNLLDVGPEAGQAAGTAVAYTANQGYTNGPYYRKAFLRVRSFPVSGALWTVSNCNGGTRDGMRATCSGPN